MSWMSEKTGRPKEEEGHKRINISLNKFTREALKKIKKDGGNISKFIEKELKPVLEQLDPRDAAIHIWRIEDYLKKQIIKAAEKGKFEEVKAICSIINAIEDYRKLAGMPSLELPQSENGFKLNQGKVSLSKDEAEKIAVMMEIAERYKLKWLKDFVENYLMLRKEE